MKLAIITDLHSDIDSLDAALARIRSMGCDQVICAGDLVDGDVFPDEVIARLAVEEIPTIRGNHDRWALERVGELRKAGRRRDLRADGPSSVYDSGDGMLGSGQELSEASLRFLARLPTSLDLEVEGVRVAVRHARPATFGNANDMVGIDPTTTSPSQMSTLLELAHADVLVVGHTHLRFAARVPGGMVVNPGALWSGGAQYKPEGGIMVPGGPSFATFGVLELPAMRFVVYRALDGEVVLESTVSARNNDDDP
jgi:putative phosphoesterase